MRSKRRVTRRAQRRLRIAAGLVLAAVSGPCLAHGTAAEHAAEHASRNPNASATVTLDDIEVLDQDGKRLRFASDVVGDKLVAITLFYSTCQTTCPVTNAVFAMVQRRLGDRMDREVRLVSLTVNPGTDTPPRIKALSEKHGARAGWVWVTGDKLAIDRVLDGLNAYTPDYTQHPVMVLVGDPRTGRWSRLFGFPNPDAIVGTLETFGAARAEKAMKVSVKVN